MSAEAIQRIIDFLFIVEAAFALVGVAFLMEKFTCWLRKRNLV